MNKSLSLLFIIAFNIAPIIGVLFFDWRPFEAFWFFWVETLIMALFNSIRIVFSQHRPADGIAANIPMRYHTGKALGYLLIRIGIFFFYAVFIIVFIGFIANSSGDKMNVLLTLTFRNRFFNLGLLISIVSQTYYMLFSFFRNGNYLKADPDVYAAIFDGRQLVVHVAVVLGTFGSTFLAKNTSFGTYSSVAIIGIFCVCKCVVELFNYGGTKASSPYLPTSSGDRG